MAREVSYYCIDRDIKYTMSGNGFVRAYVSENDVLKNYIPIKVIYFGGTAVVFADLTMACCML